MLGRHCQPQHPLLSPITLQAPLGAHWAVSAVELERGRGGLDVQNRCASQIPRPAASPRPSALDLVSGKVLMVPGMWEGAEVASWKRPPDTERKGHGLSPVWWDRASLPASQNEDRGWMRGTNLPWMLFLHCRSKAEDELALGVCTEWLERTGTSTRRL